MAQSIEQLSFELTASALAEQERQLTGLRVCAGTVLGSASIAGSFLGARAAGGALDGWGLVAITSFSLCFLSAIWVLVPHEFVLAFGGDGLLADGERDGTRELMEAYRAVSGWIETRLQVNQRKMDSLANWLTISCTMLTVEVIAWTLSLVD